MLGLRERQTVFDGRLRAGSGWSNENKNGEENAAVPGHRG
jgi:hypothetical protein